MSKPRKPLDKCRVRKQARLARSNLSITRTIRTSSQTTKHRPTTTNIFANTSGFNLKTKLTPPKTDQEHSIFAEVIHQTVCQTYSSDEHRTHVHPNTDTNNMAIAPGLGACQAYVNIAWFLLVSIGVKNIIPNVGKLSFREEACSPTNSSIENPTGMWMMYDGGPGSLQNHDYHAVLVTREHEIIDLTARHFPAYARWCSDPRTGVRLEWRLPGPETPKYLWAPNEELPKWYRFEANKKTTEEYIRTAIANKTTWKELAKLAELNLLAMLNQPPQ